MLDEKDLQAIRSLIREEVREVEQRITQSTAVQMDAQEKRIDQKLSDMEQRITKSTVVQMDAQEKRIDQKLSDMEQRITKSTVVLMDAEFGSRFNLLAEGQQDILERLVPRSRVDDLEDEVKFLKSMMRQMNEDLQKLKKAN